MRLIKKVSLAVVCATMLASGLTYALGYYLMNDLLSESIENQKEAILDAILSDVGVLDELLLSIESKWDAQLSRDLPAIAQLVKQSKADNTSSLNEALTNIKSQFAVSDIHLIDDSLKVYASTYAPEIGLDMSKFSDQYTVYLKDLFNQEEYSAHRLSLSDVDGKPKKYAYYGSLGSNYLVNVDIDVHQRLHEQIDERLGNFVFEEYVSKLENKYQLVNYIDLLLVSESNHWSFFRPNHRADADVITAIYQSDETVLQNTSTRLIPVELTGYDELGFVAVVHVEFNSSIYDSMRTRLQFLSIGICVFMVLTFLTLLNVSTRNLFLNRFETLAKQLQNKRIGDGKQIVVDGDDEISEMALKIDATMQRVETEVKLNEALYKQSHVDPLTRVYNRRYFTDRFSKEFSQSKAEHNALSIVMLDIDFFKAFNDTYGHIEGDKCLVKVARTIEACLPNKRDSVARYGGEEFICILPDTPSNAAKAFSNKLRENIENLHIEHANSAIARTITASIGSITVQGNHEITQEALLSAVDQQLYQSKILGRNRVNHNELN